MSKVDKSAADRTEGDINQSVHRSSWQKKVLNEETCALLAEDEKYFIHQSLSTPCLTALERSHGSYLFDTNGKSYLDFHGNSSHQVGYGHPHVVAAITEEMQRLPFSPRRFTNRPAVELAKKLAQLSPGNLNRMLFAPGGTSANGIALKLARSVTGRFKTLSFWDAFHGASLDAISVGGEALFRRNMGPLLPGCIQVPAPGSHCFGVDKLDWQKALGYIEYVMVHEGDVAAFIAEPMRCTTIDIPPVQFWRQIREICDRHGVLLIFDEIPLCLGRTGFMFACEYYAVVPDILCLGKGLGGGIFPMAATLIREDLEIDPAQALGHYTHEKSPVGCAAALATLEVIADEHLLQRSRELGRHTLAALHRLRSEHPLISAVRGVGLMLGIEITPPAGFTCSATDAAEQILYAAFTQGLSFKISAGNVLTLTPPLTISDAEMDAALNIIAASIAQVEVKFGLNRQSRNI
ncbi:4-aminobutyrate aminotransferase apoenzyme [Desulfuromusa kysingii]|uniref:4-aminobutyrate aminotransferase apoenzyme n=1 Tax=Desulfuromusa kysingii TaxID=37625 RepID=A0A1H4DJK4_9BACT|nr:aspartate aminotransferase family protein [Desulfuromusa kysingii]SEA72894.1 4-aminobutyrate aminotransferase apoenzyme [Desulfuromusa kysingii]